MSLKDLDDLGIKYNTAYQDDSKISNILIPFTPRQWFELCTRDGECYIGGCCGQTGYLQDILNSWFRDSGWASGKDLWEFCNSMASHDGTEDFDSGYLREHGLKRTIKDYKKYREGMKEWAEEGQIFDPWIILGVIWKLAKDHLYLERPPRRGRKLSDLDDAVRVIAASCQSLSWAGWFKRDGEKEPDAQARSARALMMYRLYPALKTFNERVQEYDMGAVDGFAICIPSEGDEEDEIATNGFGLCVYETTAKAQKMIDDWKSNREDDEEYIDRLKIRPVRVTVEDGLAFTDR